MKSIEMPPVPTGYEVLAVGRHQELRKLAETINPEFKDAHFIYHQEIGGWHYSCYQGNPKTEFGHLCSPYGNSSPHNGPEDLTILYREKLDTIADVLDGDLFVMVDQKLPSDRDVGSMLMRFRNNLVVLGQPSEQSCWDFWPLNASKLSTYKIKKVSITDVKH